MKWKFRSAGIGAAAAAAAAMTVVSALPAGASVDPGETTVVVNPAVVSTLVGLGVGAVAPGTLTPSGNTVVLSFPITGISEGGVVNHSGGLDFSKVNGTSDVKVTLFHVNVKTELITAVATVNSTTVGRIPLFNIVAPRSINGHVASCHGVAAGLTLTSGAASALGAPSATRAFIGDACVTPSD